MRLGILIPEFPGQTHGFFWREICWLQRFGLPVEVISTRRPSAIVQSRHEWAPQAQRQAKYLMPLMTRGGINVVQEACRTPLASLIGVYTSATLRASSIHGRARNVAIAIASMQLRRICRQRHISHLHVHSCADSAQLAALCRQMGGPPYSLVLHSPVSCFGGNQLTKWQGADFGVFVSRYVRDEFSQFYPDALPSKLLISPMGYDENLFIRQKPYVSWNPAEALRLVSCSRVTRGKGIDTLIELVACLRQSGIDARLQIAGGADVNSGDYMLQVQQLAEQLQVADRIEFLGNCSATRIRDVLSGAHIFVTATRQEAIGVAIMEAMAMGLPVVATRVGGIPELIEDGKTGRLVPVDSAQALKDAIVAITESPRLAQELGRAASAHVGRAYTSGRSAERLLSALLEWRPELLRQSGWSGQKKAEASNAI